jgi:hypothetical protein
MKTRTSLVTTPRRPTPAEVQTVRRRVDLPLPAVEPVLGDPLVFGRGTTVVLGGRGILRVDDPFTFAADWPAVTWRAAVTALGRRAGLRTSARMWVEVTEWSHGGCEVLVTPVSRHLELWGARRQRRYYALAHDTADHVARSLAQAARHRQDRQLRLVITARDADVAMLTKTT